MRVHDVAAGDQVLALAVGEGLVNDVVFSPDGRLLATARPGGTVGLWETVTGRLTRRMDAGRDAIARTVAFSPDGTLLAAGFGDGAVRIWSMSTGEQQRLLTALAAPVTDVAFSPGGAILAAADDGMVRVWQAAESGEPMFITRNDSWVMGTAFSPDGTLLASGGQDGRLNIYATTGEFVRSGDAGRDRVSCVAFSRDGSLLAVGRDNGAVEIWQVATAERQAVLEGHTGAVYDVAFSPADPLLIASAGNDGTVRLWRQPASGDQVSS